MALPCMAADGERIQVDTEVLSELVEEAEGTKETAADLGITALAAVLMEAETGTVLYEKNPDQALSPASITKIMTLILIFEAIDEGKLDYDDVVTTSEHAKSMGGSQVFLETGEQQTVETMIKCIIIRSEEHTFELQSRNAISVCVFCV